MPAFVDFKTLREEVSVWDVLSRVGWSYRFSCGDVKRGPCPIHGTTSRTSTTLHITRTAWYCWKCRQHGDVIDLYAALHHCTLRQAGLELAAIFHVAMPEPPPRSTWNKGEGRLH